MNLIHDLRRTWRHFSITAKFALTFALLVGLIVFEAILGYAALHAVQKAENVILTSVEIRQHVFDMDGGLEKARRLHRDFFLQYPEIGFTRAQELYFEPSNEVIARVVAQSEELKRLLESSTVSEALRERQNDVNLYLSTAKRFSGIFKEVVELVTALAAPGAGLQDQLARVETELGRLAGHAQSTHLLFRDMVATEREFRVTRKRPVMQTALNIGFSLEQAFVHSELPPREKAAAAALLKEYVNLATAILDNDVAIRSKFHDFALQSKTADPISENLKALATAEVDRARGKIAQTSRWATFIIVMAALTGIGFALTVALLVHVTVTRKLVALTLSAGELRAGNLDVCVEAQSGDELGELAATFNDMACRMKDLIGNLEGIVLERTEELTDTRDRLQDMVREMDEKNQALEVLSVTDRLTSLANRRKLETTLQSELLRARRYGKPFSLIMLDVDRFKKINDTYGHSVGDSVLVQIARVLIGNARETDVVGRWGGEEFMVICPETRPSVVAALAERFRQELEMADFGPVGTVTASFGVSSFLKDDDLHSLVRRTDEALYRAKEFGRNRVEVDHRPRLH